MKITSQLPNLIIIGAMKCGTTSLHAYLSKHPETFMSEVKEIDYFVKESRWTKGVEWYKRQFVSNALVRGESSQNYSKRHHFEPNVPRRIYELIPDARFIYIVRDPISRIVSHYHEALEGGYAPPEGLNQYLSGDLTQNHYVLTSSYFYQLQLYLDFFSEKNILVCTLEELKANRLETMNRIFRFLGLSECTDDQVFDFVCNARSTKRCMNLVGRFISSPSSKCIRHFMPREFKDSIKRNSLSKKLTTRAVAREYLSDRVYQELSEVLIDDIRLFRRLAKSEFHQWPI